MSLLKILLEDFNPNQKTIGGKRGLEKVRADLENIDPPDVDNSPKDKQEVLDMLSVNSEVVNQTIEDFLQADYDWSTIEDRIRYTDWYKDVFETHVDNYQAQDGFDEVFDVKRAKEVYEGQKGKAPDNLEELKDFLDTAEIDFDDWEFILDIDYYDDILYQMAKDELKNDIEDNLWELEDTVDNSKKINGEDCIHLFRAIRINFDKGVTLQPKGGLGLYWSFMEDGAKAYGASMQGEDLIVYAWVPLSSVSWGDTIYKNVWNLRHEKEVQLMTEHPLYIEKISVDQSGSNKEDLIREKALFIAKTYFSKKYEKIKDNWTKKHNFIKNIKNYLKENNMVSNKYTLTFNNNYYKSKA